MTESTSAAPAASTGPGPSAAPYDVLLLVSFGGPEGPDDVVPFLENVTRGRGIPRERLEEVGQHYYARGGVSPINGQNRALVAALEAELAERGVDLPVRWGNRNWDPYLTDAFAALADDGAGRVLSIMTSAYSSYSGCRQYRENLYAAVEPLGERAPAVDRVRHYFDHPGFVRPMVEHTVAALDGLPGDVRRSARLVFVTHSVPLAMNDGSGPTGGAYVAQHRAVADLVAEGVAERLGTALEGDLVYCSRSGPPSQPWLEPDVNDHLEELAAQGVPAAVLVPIGFVSDHMEVVHDLDTEALDSAARLGLPCTRAATVGTHPLFVRGLVDLVLERAAVERGEAVDRPALSPLGPSHDRCPAGCCPNLRDPGRPVLCGELLDLAVAAATEAARLVVEERPRAGRELEVAATKSSATDIVTEMDRRSERVIVDRLLAARPDDGVLGEEGADHEGTSGITWVVDPIDGTVNYLYEIPSYAVSIGASDVDGPLVGVVVNPVSGETWTAVRGGGAFLDGRQLRLAEPPPLEMALVATGFGYGRNRRARQAEILRSVLPVVRDIRRAGAASLDLCALATGRVDAYYEQGLQPWDLAAGGLVATEAGAVVTGLRGRPASEALVVAAAPGLVEPLTALLSDLAADELVDG